MTSHGLPQIHGTQLDIARALWTYGEDQLWPEAKGLPAALITEILEVARKLGESSIKQQGRPPVGNAALAIAAIKVVEGRLRPLARKRRRDRKHMPAQLLADDGKAGAADLL